MIDEEKVKARVDDMNKSNLQNLLMALSVEKYLVEIFGSVVDTAYNPDVGAMLVRCRDPRSNALKNVVESVKRTAHENPGRVRYFSTDGTSGARMEFAGGFSVMATRIAGVE